MNAQPNKKKVSFNIIDVLLIAAVLIAAVLLIFYVKNRRIVLSDSANTVEVVYQLRVSPLREEFRNLVAVGDAVTDADTLRPIGEVTNVSYSACYYTGTDRTTGAPVTSAYPGMITMTLTVKVSASATKTGYSVGNRPLTLGDSVNFRVPDFTGTGVCTSVSRTTPALPAE